MKTEDCNLVNNLNFYLTNKSTEKTFSVFSLTNLIVFCKYKKTTECDACNTLKKSWERGKKKLQVPLFWKVPQLAF